MAPITGRRSGPGESQFTSVLTTVLLTVFLVYSLLPVFYLVVSSTKDNTDLFSSFGLWFASFSLTENLRDTFTRDGGVFWN